MKQIRFYTLFLTALLSVLVSCDPVEPEPEPVPEPDPSLQVGSSSIDLGAEGGSQSVTLTANYDWSAKTTDSWLQVSPVSGQKGSASLTISADANNTGKARKGTVTVVCRSVNRTISVSQPANLAQSLVITHENTLFSIPVISGSGVTGKVSWGDGAEETYTTSLSHTYSSSGSHTVTIKLNGGTAFDLASIAGVKEIDVTEF